MAKRSAKSKRAQYKHHGRSRRSSRNPFKSRRRRHSNPFSFSARGAKHDVTAALIGAGGAVLTDVAMAYAAPYLPDQLKSGWINVLTRAAAAVGVGYVAGRVAGAATGKAITAGGLLVVAYSGLKQALAPTLGTSIKGLSGLADFGDYRAAVPYSSEGGMMSGGGLGSYMVPRGGFGAYMSPGAVLRPALSAGAAASPIRSKQLGAYMNSGRQGFSGFGRFAGAYDYMQDEGSMM